MKPDAVFGEAVDQRLNPVMRAVEFLLSMIRNKQQIYLANRHQEGFTLIELMVVISVLTFLASIILTSVVTARRSARDVIVKQNIKTLDNAFRLYQGDMGVYPPTQYISSGSGNGAYVEICNSTSDCGVSLTANKYLNTFPAPPKGAYPLDYVYSRRIDDQLNLAAQVAANCDLIGNTCGFKAPTTYASCHQTYGNVPDDAVAKAVLIFWLENGQSNDYVKSTVFGAGGNAICLY